MPKRRIMILEDDALIAIDIAAMVEELGHKSVGPFRSAQDARKALCASGVDFALLDFELSGENSAELAELLNGRDVPFAFVTGHARDHLPERFADTPILVKPVSEIDLERLLDS